ncbi:MAG: hypothetical protein WDO56_23965 [Gammaproteobacteria bacterium]
MRKLFIRIVNGIVEAKITRRSHTLALITYAMIAPTLINGNR